MTATTTRIPLTRTELHHTRHCAICDRRLNAYRESNHCHRCEAAGLTSVYRPALRRTHCPGCDTYPFKAADQLCYHCARARKEAA